MSQRSKNAKRVAAIAATAGVALICYNFLRLDRPVDRPHITAAMVKRAVPDYAVIDKEFRPAFYYSPGTGQKPTQAIWCRTRQELWRVSHGAAEACGLLRSHEKEFDKAGYIGMASFASACAIFIAFMIHESVRNTKPKED